MNEQSDKDILDVSELDAPEPLIRITQKLKELQPGEVLIVRHRIEPMGLYKKINPDEFSYSSEKRGEHFYITIRKKEVSK